MTNKWLTVSIDAPKANGLSTEPKFTPWPGANIFDVLRDVSFQICLHFSLVKNLLWKIK